MKLDLVQIILLLAAGQGFLLAALILHKHRSFTATRLLGALMLLLSGILVNLILSDSKNIMEEPLWLFPIGLPLVFGPFQFLYTKYLIRPSERFQRTDWLHLVPYGLYASVVVGCVISLRFRTDLFQNTIRDVPISFLGFNEILSLSGMAYSVLAVVTLMRHARRLESVFSNTERVRLDWLRRISYALFMGWFILFVETFLFIAGIQFGPRFAVSSSVGGVLVYLMGYLGLVHSDVFLKPEIAGPMRELSDIRDRDKSRAGHSQKKYQKSGLPSNKAAEHRDALLRLMESEKPYIDPYLTLSHLSEKLSINTHNLSEVINTQFDQNFFDFVNAYRMEQAKRDLADPAKRELKILAIAYDAGFNSKTSFNTLFKKHTGLSPSEFRERVGRS
jgi:AraC-like DNA-binding protein